MTSGQFNSPDHLPERNAVEFAVSAKYLPVEGDGRCACDVSVKVRTTDNSEESEESEETGLQILANYEVLFSIEGEHEQEAIEAFARLNGVFTAWPYMREFTQSCTCRMDLPPLTLPLVTAPAIANHLSKDEDVDIPAIE
ncbi:hypothetical protein [Aporhodopirellula rubra]|nr:hypothetical protein [Aporhodopirellula rubra]